MRASATFLACPSAHSRISLALRPPLYSTALRLPPFLPACSSLMVGKPLMPNSAAHSCRSSCCGSSRVRVLQEAEIQMYLQAPCGRQHPPLPLAERLSARPLPPPMRAPGFCSGHTCVSGAHNRKLRIVQEQYKMSTWQASCCRFAHVGRTKERRTQLATALRPAHSRWSTNLAGARQSRRSRRRSRARAGVQAARRPMWGAPSSVMDAMIACSP